MEAAAEDSPRRALSTTQLYRFEHIKGEIVEQPSAQIWVLAFNAVSSAMSYISPDSNTDRVFNNADSFAMVFDATWRTLTKKNTYETQNEKIISALDAMSDHPFMISSPETARQVATFRIRLLELD